MHQLPSSYYELLFTALPKRFAFQSRIQISTSRDNPAYLKRNTWDLAESKLSYRIIFRDKSNLLGDKIRSGWCLFRSSRGY